MRLKYLVLTLLTFLLQACGESGTSSSSSGSGSTFTVGQSSNIELSITYASGSTVTSLAQATVTVKVRTDAKVAVVNTSVTLVTTLGVLSQASVLTDSKGEASFTISVGTVSGASSVTATANVGGVVKTQKIDYSVSISNSSVADLKLGFLNTTTNVFSNGTLNAAIGTSTLSAFGTTTITASVVDSSNALFKTATTVSFSSVCAKASQATIAATATTQAGVASVTYQSTSCVGSDTITATITNNGTTSTATVAITVAADKVGSIQFISASPKDIALKGSGGVGRSESSQVKFKVIGESGIALTNKKVKFYLDNIAGGIALLASEGETDANGEVIAIVKSGSTDATVKVTAEVEVSSSVFITTQSDQLINSIGLADQNSITISTDTLAPEVSIQSGANTEVTIVAFAADAYNHSVPDGTAILIETEGGAIKGSNKCFTVDGKCSVTWIAHDPQPADNRSTIMAYMVGNETFFDRANAGAKQGIFDFVDVFDDLPEAFLDTDESSRLTGGLYTTTAGSLSLNSLNMASTNGYNPTRFNAFTNDFSREETFKDYNADGLYSAADGDFNGVVCDTNSNRCPATKTSNGISNLMGYVRDSLVLIMASPTPVVTITTPAATNTNYTFPTGGTPVAFSVQFADRKALCLNAGHTNRTDVVDIDTSTTNTCIGGTVSIRQSSPTKSEITIVASTGEISTGIAETIPNTSSAFTATFTITPSADNAAVEIGALTASLKTPSGVTVSRSITLTDPIN